VKLPENQGSEPLTPDGNLRSLMTFSNLILYASDEGVTVAISSFSLSRARAATTSTSSLTAAEIPKTCISLTLLMRLT
jgi:hypothetical protein